MADILKQNNNNIWSRLQSDNQKPPDSKTRVRFLLDEIALLQTAPGNNDRPVQSNHEKFAFLKVESPTALNEKIREETVQVESDEQPYEYFLKNAEETLTILVTEFYEKAAKELRAGTLDKWEIAKLLELEKSKLQRHRKHVEKLQVRLTKSLNRHGGQEIRTHGQDLVDKLGQWLTERESFLLKFEVQVELGHVFRLLKLVEVQKKKHETFRKELDQVLDNIRVAVQVENEFNIVKQEPADDVEQQCFSGTQQDTDWGHDSGNNNSSISNVEKIPDYSRYRKEAKVELLKIIAEQEESWKSRKNLVDDLERRLLLSEQENRRLSNVLKDKQVVGNYNFENRKDVPDWSSGCPEGFTSIYWSPIFQERKTRESKKFSKPQEHEGYDYEMEEIARLKIQLKRESFKENNYMANESDVCMEEKTISVDSTCQAEGNPYSEVESLKNQIEVLKNDMARDADKHAQEIESKTKALAYAQGLNLQLASDLSTTENALSKLCAEYKETKTSFESMLDDAKTEAEDLVRSLRQELDASNQKVEESRRKMQAETGLEKQDLLARIQILTDEAARQSSHALKLQQSLDECKDTSIQREAKFASSVEMTSLKDELDRTKGELKRMEEERNCFQDRLLESEYELAQREAALERLTLHLAASIENQSVNQMKSVESLRSKHSKMQRAKQSIIEVEEKLENMSLEWSRARMEMEEIRSFVRQIHH